MCDLILEHASDPRRLEADPGSGATMDRGTRRSRVQGVERGHVRSSGDPVARHRRNPSDPRPCVLPHRSRGGPASGERGRPEAAPAARRGGHGSRRRLICRPALRPVDHKQTTHSRSLMVTNGHWRSVQPGGVTRRSLQSRGSRGNVAFLHTAEATGSNPVSPTRCRSLSGQGSWVRGVRSGVAESSRARLR